MKYFVFDLDSTLAEVYPVYYFLACLKIKYSLFEIKPIMAMQFPKELEKQLDNAYNLFVNRIEEQESSNYPLGIIRPGMLRMMSELNQLKKSGKIKGLVIYSNNSHLPTLEFIRDIIHTHTDSKRLVLDCIHRLHYLRKSSIFYQNKYYNKTWVELKKIMIECSTRAPHSIKPSDVFFFDDMDHTDLHDNLKENYYEVPAYSYHAGTDRIFEIYKECLEKAQVDMSSLLFYINYVFLNQKNGHITNISMFPSFEQSIQTLKATIEFIGCDIKAASVTNVPNEDHAIGMVQHAIKRVKDQYKTVKLKALSKRISALTYKRRRYI
jgi:hypothetical protein